MASKNLAFFDIDNTLIRGQSQEYFIRYLFKHGYLNFIAYIKILLWFFFYRLKIAKNPKKIIEYTLSRFNGFSVRDLEIIISDFFDKELKKFFYKDALNLVQDFKDNDFEIFLVSNAFDLLVKVVAEYLGIPSFIATSLDVEGGFLTGRIRGEIMYGQNKKFAIKKVMSERKVETGDTYAFGDHISDLVMLESVGNPRVVNPSAQMEKIAHKRGWPVIYFDKKSA